MKTPQVLSDRDRLCRSSLICECVVALKKAFTVTLTLPYVIPHFWSEYML